MENSILLKENLSQDLLKSRLKELQNENSDLKNNLAVVHELLRRYKLTEVTELNKQIVNDIQKDLLYQLKIMKENTEAQSRTICTQKQEIKRLKAHVSNFESSSVASPPSEHFQSRESLQSELDSLKLSYKTLQSEYKSAKSQFIELDQARWQNSSLKSEVSALKQKLEQKEDSWKVSSHKQTSLLKRIENLNKTQKTLEDKVSELEADKRKLLEKWQMSLNKIKTDDQLKSRVKEIEESLECEKKKNLALSNKLRELSKKFEETKENFEKEKNYNNELTSAFKSLNASHKALLDEKTLTGRNNENFIKVSQSEQGSPEKMRNEGFKVEYLKCELEKTQQLLRKKSQELIDLEFKSSQNTPRDDFVTLDKELVYYQRYENLIEKFHKLQSEKTQIQNLYVMASTAISEKNQRIQELSNKIFEFEERLLSNTKISESMRHHSSSITAASRGTF